MSFSELKLGLFFFSASSPTAGYYEQLFDYVRWGERLGFHFVSTPERHFDQFGGPFPNPAVLSAALASLTTRMQIRAGSLITPLHSIVRIVEDWSLVDAISGGRTAISIGSGWHPRDFVLAPDAFHGRHDTVKSHLTELPRLWSGRIYQGRLPNGETTAVELLPRPVSQNLPLWLTTSGSTRAFSDAGETGVNLLTHLETQSLAELGAKINLYRNARRLAGHDPASGTVTLMQHCFVAETEARAREVAKPALKLYLQRAMGLEQRSTRAGELMSGGRAPGALNLADDRVVSSVADYSMRLYEKSALIGSQERCRIRLEDIADAGVNEVACLVDFVEEPALVKDSMAKLIDLMPARASSHEAASSDR